jgi:hypothetical protein
MSWDELDAITLDVRDVQQSRDDLDRLTMRVFGTEDGQKLLMALKATFVDVPVAAPGTDPSFAYFAEGQRDVIRGLIARIQRARKL